MPSGTSFPTSGRLNSSVADLVTLPSRSGPRCKFAGTRLPESLLATPTLGCSLGPVREDRYSVRRDRSHASLGQAPPADFCNTHRRASTPKRAFDPRPEQETAVSTPFRRWVPSVGDEQRGGDRSRQARAESARAKDLHECKRPSSSPLSSTRVTGSPRRGGWRLPPIVDDSAETRFRRRPALS